MTSFVRLAIPDVVEITPKKFADDRGFFSEVWKSSAFEEQGLYIDWVQDNQSLSAGVGTVRGLHYQSAPYAQHKLVRVLRGAVYDVVVDVRRGSPTYGGWVSLELAAEKFNQLLVPIGFAHGFMTLLPDTEVIYKVSAPYSAAHERTIRWDDPDLGISWPRSGPHVILSSRDAVAPAFAELEQAFEYRPS